MNQRVFVRGRLEGQMQRRCDKGRRVGKGDVMREARGRQTEMQRLEDATLWLSKWRKTARTGMQAASGSSRKQGTSPFLEAPGRLQPC